MRPPATRLPSGVGGRVCQAMRRFSSNSMTSLSIEYGTPSFIAIPNFDPSVSRSGPSFTAAHRAGPVDVGVTARVGEQLEDLVGWRRDDALHRLDVVGHGGTVPPAGPAGQSVTTERSTSPRSIRWNAASTSSSAIVSETNRSRSKRPCR